MPWKSLLCVDDDSETLTTRQRLLEANGYSVISTTSGSEALNILSSGTKVDLVLLDYLMPEMNGDEVARKLHEKYPELPLLAVSAVEPLPEGFQKLVKGSVRKGLDPQVLLGAISAIVGEAEDHGSRPEPAKKIILCVEDEELQLKARTALFKAAGYQVLEAQSAKAAVEQFSSTHVDAVVMDYWLTGPGGNGTAAAELMKRMSPRIPIVMLSGLGSLPGERTVVDAWMRKAGLDPEGLIREVERLIELRASPICRPQT